LDSEEQIQQTRFGNAVQMSAPDRALLPASAGEGDGADPASSEAVDGDQTVGAQPRNNVTDEHQPGMGANETADGLSGTEEAVRAAAEDAIEGAEFEETPVFDRADILRKII
jgi:hypothetical protein